MNRGEGKPEERVAGQVLQRGTLGRARHHMEVSGFILTETVHAPWTNIENHAHAHASLNLVLAGGYGEQTTGCFQVHPPATLIVKPSGEQHANRIGATGTRCLLVEFRSDAREDLGELAEALSQPAVLGVGPVAGGVTRLLGALRAELPPLAVEEAVLDLLRSVRGRRTLYSEGSRPKWLRAVRDQVHAAAPERLRLQDLARSAEVHPSYLSEVFRQCFGRTITAYLQELRLDRAACALVTTNDSVSRIALRCGFYDHSQFSRSFRRTTGLTPSQFRRSVRS